MRRRTRLLMVSLAMLLASTPAGAAQGQAGTVRCSANDRDFRGCALLAGGVADLRETVVGADAREIRLWHGGGIEAAAEVLVVRQTHDSSSGARYLLWPSGRVSDSVHRARCAAERWSNAAAGLCVDRASKPVDWGALFRTLDSLGIRELPSRPISAAESLRGIVTDAPAYWLEYRSAAVYWRYSFAAGADRSSPEGRRDAAILQALNCSTGRGPDQRCGR